MIHQSINRRQIQKVSEAGRFLADDNIAVEEPLEIRLRFGPPQAQTEKPVSITMRTPGNDAELALGFLFTEGVIPDRQAVVRTEPAGCSSICVELDPKRVPDIAHLQRHFYTSSSCGVCGKSSIESLKKICPTAPVTTSPISSELIHSLPEKLDSRQTIFRATGGLHAAALFDGDGECIAIREDIGRHNAVDKLIGYALQQQRLPLSDHILLLSGRACYELIQKAAMAGIAVIAAVGAPSSLAIQTAESYGMTLIGFLRADRFNIYTGSHRLITEKIALHV